MNHYRCSDGTSISKSIIDRRVRETKKQVLFLQKDMYGYNLCEKCSTIRGPLDCSHIESVDSCQKNGRADKAWAFNNIEVLCRRCHDFHHVKKEVITLQS